MKLALILFLLTSFAARTQVVYGSLTGAVTDASGAPIAAEVSAIHEATAAERKVQANADGSFLFNGLTPGAYTIAVNHPGFNAFRKTGIVLSPNETIATGAIQLTLGSVTETVTVTAAGATVQTASGERSGIITSEQIENLSVINRDFAALVSLMPGVVTEPGSETQGFGGTSTYNVQGTRTTGNNITIDGMPSGDLGNATSTTAFVSMDSVATVKILVSNFQAEFGRKPGAGIQAVTKSGGRQFHGAAYVYKRHEQFNANEFFNNRDRLPIPRYRYSTLGFNIGGPISKRHKLFFFASTEYIREARPQPIRQLTMPTAAERLGNFSDSRDLNGTLIPVRDPLNNRTPFPDNTVPANRILPATQKYLNLLPQPNFFNLAISARRYNYQVQESLDIPKHMETGRIDWVKSEKTTIYGRGNTWWEDVQGWAVPGGNANWGWLPSRYRNTSKTGILSATRILSPTTLAEVSIGIGRHTETGGALDPARLDTLNRTKSGATLPQSYPQFNPLNLVPQATFTGVTGAPSVTYEARFPMRGSDTLLTANGNLTRHSGAHTLKAGYWLERAINIEGDDGNFAGTYSFNRNTNNPADSNHPFANALLGNFDSYTESTRRPNERAGSTTVEWFAQDNWKATRRLMLDIGLRFAWTQPYHSLRNQEAGFLPDRFLASKQVQLIQPFRNGNTRVGRHPVTGQLFPVEAIGAIAPNTGDPFNGTVNRVTEPEYTAGLRYTGSVKTAPRFGFAYDPFGRGKTAIRGGWGMFMEVREKGNRSTGSFRNPPLRLDPIIYQGSLSTFANLPQLNFPSATSGFDPNRPLSRIMNFSFGVQQDIGWGVIADVSYVGSLGRHLVQARNINSVPYGTNFLPSSLDSTNANRPLPAAFLRPYPGYNDIRYYDYTGNSNYHSLQATANRRFIKGVSFGAAWTYSKAMDYTDTEDALLSTQVNPRVWNYGRAGFDRMHIVKLNWVWDAPRLSRLLPNRAAKFIGDGWQISGIATFQGGPPRTVTVSLSTVTDLSGSPTESSRAVLIAKPTIPNSEKTFSRQFNTAAFAPPAAGTPGNAAKDLFRGPGIHNWDISLFKNFQIPELKWRFQLRGEFYNAFNHTQFTTIDTAARFDGQGNQTNARFGELTGSRGARRVQLALRLTF
jgi:hypothetical protein